MTDPITIGGLLKMLGPYIWIVALVGHFFYQKFQTNANKEDISSLKTKLSEFNDKLNMVDKEVDGQKRDLNNIYEWLREIRSDVKTLVNKDD